MTDKPEIQFEPVKRRARSPKKNELATTKPTDLASIVRGKSAFTPQRQRNIVEAVRKGLTVSGAAGREGLDRSTVNGWVRRGEDEPDGPYGKFAAAVLQAKAEREGFLLDKLEQHFDKQWMAVARALEVTNADWKQPGKESAPPVEINFNLEKTIAKMEEDPHWDNNVWD
jgi:hypothetical protein